MHKDIQAYNKDQANDRKAICELLVREIQASIT